MHLQPANLRIIIGLHAHLLFTNYGAQTSQKILLLKKEKIHMLMVVVLISIKEQQKVEILKVLKS